MILIPHEYVSFMARWDIGPKEFLLVYLLYLAEYEKRTGRRIYSRPAYGKQDPRSSLYHYAEWSGKLDDDTERIIHARLTPSIIAYLVDKKILAPGTDVRTRWLDDLKLHSNFKDALFTSIDDFEEFWDLYPGYHNSNGQRLTLKSGDKGAYEKLYLERVVVKDMHQRVMEITRWAKRKGYINISINNYLLSEQWNEFEKEMAEEPSSLPAGGVLV